MRVGACDLGSGARFHPLALQSLALSVNYQSCLIILLTANRRQRLGNERERKMVLNERVMRLSKCCIGRWLVHFYMQPNNSYTTGARIARPSSARLGFI